MDETASELPTNELRPGAQDRQERQAFWASQGQEWRTEPEISPDRQADLAARRRTTPDIAQGIYPFSGVKLSRADVEWLLATHDEGQGPVDYHEPRQRDRVGLDLRGADLSNANLQNLPLARTLGDVSWRTWTQLTEKQHRMAAIHLQQADLKGAHLEGSGLEYAQMEGADLRGCNLEEADLGTAYLQGAYCEGANMEGADLWFAHLEGAFLWRVNLRRARLYQAHLAGAHLEGLVLVDEHGVGPRLVDTLWEDANLAVVDWSQIRILGDEYEARQKGRVGTVKDPPTRLEEYEAAARANRQLALALQAQGLSDEAAGFFYRAQVLHRKALWLGGLPRFGQYLFSLFLAVLTGYGYRMGRLLAVYLLLIGLFATIYALFGVFSAPPHLGWAEALIVSFTAFHGRVYSIAFSPGTPLSIVAAVEAVTGLIFEGVFIAMLTQRFFRR